MQQQRETALLHPVIDSLAQQHLKPTFQTRDRCNSLGNRICTLRNAGCSEHVTGLDSDVVRPKTEVSIDSADFGLS